MADGVPAEPAGVVDEGTLLDPERLRALECTGLGAASDPDMEDHAEWARSALGADAAVVSLVQADRQVLPGAAGLGEPLASTRAVTIEQSVCKVVVMQRAALVVPDVDEHGWLRDNALVRDARVRAYAGVPLTDRDGRVLGTLAAIEREPRAWSERDRAILERIARSCSTALRLRLADHDAGREERRRDEREAGLQRAFDRTQTLLGASQAFTETVTVDDVRIRIGELLTEALAATHVDVVVADRRRRLHRLEASGAPADAHRDGVGSLEDHSPASRAIATRQVRHHPDRAAIDEAHPGASGDPLRALGVHSLVAAPLLTGEDADTEDGVAGAVVLGWSQPHAVEPADLLTVATLAGFAGQALGRARRLSYRTGVAHEMQNAMLTTLPKVADLSMAARYTPADGRENVGGDWYDAVPLVDPDDPDGELLMLSVGDVVGHALHAVTIMGQVRCMVRQAAADHPGEAPSRILDSFEVADRQFGVGATGTAVVAHLRRGTEGWSFTWTNAGHPPPIIVGPDGRSELLEEHDVLFGFHLTEPGDRRDHRRELPPGSLLFLYTDGLVERRDSDIDSGIERVRRYLEAAHDREPRDLVQAVVDDLAPQAPDDVVALAVRVPRS